MNNRMVRLYGLKESLTYYYKKHADIIRPILKGIISLLSLLILRQLFLYNDSRIFLWMIVVVSLIQAFVPLAFLYYTGTVLIAVQLWSVSMDITVGFLALILAGWLLFVRLDGKYACVAIITPVLFWLRMEYLIPVILGITIGYGVILPVGLGTLIYYMGLYTADASSLLMTTSGSGLGSGLQRIVGLMVMDKKLLVILISFSLVIFIADRLNRMFHESAWLFSIVIGHIALALLLLSGKYIFELDYSIWRVFLGAVLGIAICVVLWFFRGIGDVSRMERATFEDDEYIYYVKAVPKIKVPAKNVTVTRIEADEDEMMDDLEFEQGEDEAAEEGAAESDEAGQDEQVPEEEAGEAEEAAKESEESEEKEIKAEKEEARTEERETAGTDSPEDNVSDKA